MPIKRQVLGLIAAFTPVTVCAAPPPVLAHFQSPMYAKYHLATGSDDQSRLVAPIVVDLATGAGAATCQNLGGWTGQATFHNTEQGTLVWWGTGQGCVPFGYGTLQYPDGSLYSGGVETLIDNGDDAVVLQRGRIRLAVRHGHGQYYDPRTAAQQVGRFERDAFVQDLSGDASFIAALQAANASVTDRAAPRWTPAVRHLLFQWKAATAAPSGIAAAPALPIGTGTNVGADAVRQARAQAALDPTQVPAQIIAAHPDLAALSPALARYGMTITTGLPEIASKFLGGVKCKSPAGQDARWSRANVFEVARLETAPAIQDAYLGEHVECKPRGIGRYRFGAHEWIGQVDNLRMREEGLGTSIEGKISAMPAGVGEIRLSDGTRLFVKASYILPEKAERSGYMFGRIRYEAFYGLVDKEGTVAVALKPNRNSQFDAVDTGWAFFQSDLAQNKELTEHRLDGTYLTSMFDMKTGQPAGGPIKLVNVEGGYLIQGSVAVAGDGTEPYFHDRVDFELTREREKLPAGQYYALLGTQDSLRGMAKWRASLSKHTQVLHPVAYPANTATLMRVATKGGACPIPAGELPPGWVAWTPFCPAGSASAYAPDLSLKLNWSFADDGSVKQRSLSRSPGMGDKSKTYSENWSAAGFRAEGGRVVPVGVTEYTIYNGNQRTWRWVGPMNGLLAEGLGQCEYLGKMEPCEMRGNTRVDAVHRQREAEQRLVQQRRSEQRAREAAAERERNRLAALEQQRQEAAEEEERLRRQMEDEAEEEEEATPHWTETFAKAMGQVANDMAQVNAQRQQDLNAKQAQIADLQRRQRELQDAQQQWNQGVQAHNQSQKADLDAIVAGARARPSSTYSDDEDSGGNGSGSSGSGGSSARPSSQSYSASKDDCGQLGRDLMSAKYKLEQRCLRQKRDDETFSAWRDFQNSCMADGRGEVDSLQAEYAACSKRDPSEGGVVRY